MSDGVDRTAEQFPESEIVPVELKFRKILLATDGSAPAVKATKIAVALAKEVGAELTAVFVRTGEDALLYPEERLADEVLMGVHPSEAGLELARKFAEVNGVKCKTEILRGGVAPQIVKYAERENFDLIILGDTGRTGLARLAMGSVAEAVVKASSVPVMVIKK
ncbi:MAG: universal stress protein [Actinobacteria bacterium]|nr:universal stress protein [Actinomycetota bacterium]